MENCHGSWVFPLMKLEVSSWLVEKSLSVVLLTYNGKYIIFLENLGTLTYIEGI